jgi:hypothetical protein
VDREGVGDECIGWVLSGAAPGQDGIWPPELIRDLIEELASPRLVSGLASGKFNSMGATWRGLYEGGQQEVELAERYEAWSREVMVHWPEAGRLLKGMARSYRRRARDFDEEAQQAADSV